MFSPPSAPPRLAKPTYRVLGVVVLALAGFNLSFHMDREMVHVWDESLYATSALEMFESGNWVVTTFQGAVDYANSKPPLNTWLIATSFSLFGVNLVALRLPAVVAAWLTVLVVYVWTRRHLGDAVAALAALVLGTTYGFIYVHSGRSANTDVHITLLVTLAFVVLASARTRAWHTVALGPIAAGVFMLKGPAALAYIAPLVVAHGVALRRAGTPLISRARPWALAAVLFTLPVSAWAYARWQFDGWLFFMRMLSYDALGRGRTAVEGHGESPLYYFDVLQRYQYEWLIAAAAAALLAPPAMRGLYRVCAARGLPMSLVLAWVVGAFLVPTVVPTKLAWYIDPVYPLFAMAVAVVLHEAWQWLSARGHATRARLLVVVVALAVVSAEGKMAWQSYKKVDIDRSAQGLLIGHADLVRGRRVFAPICPRPEWFLARAAGSRCLVAHDIERYLAVSDPQDLWLDAPTSASPAVTALVGNSGAALYARRR